MTTNATRYRGPIMKRHLRFTFRHATLGPIVYPWIDNTETTTAPLRALLDVMTAAGYRVASVWEWKGPDNTGVNMGRHC